MYSALPSRAVAIRRFPLASQVFLDHQLRWPCADESLAWKVPVQRCFNLADTHSRSTDERLCYQFAVTQLKVHRRTYLSGIVWRLHNVRVALAQGQDRIHLGKVTVQ